MGWWSTEIFGGDTPLDCRGHIEKVLGMKYDYSKCITDIETIRKEVITHGFDPELFQSKIDDIFANTNTYDKDIYLQVVGALCANMGIKITDEQKNKVMYAINNELRSLNYGSDWGYNRRHSLETLKTAVMTYTSEGHTWNEADEARAQEIYTLRIGTEKIFKKHMEKEAKQKLINDALAIDACQNI